MHPDKDINQDLIESRQQHTRDFGQETPEFDAVMLFRALGYVVGLLSFMVGTAIFMLGYSLQSESLTTTACTLYSLALVSLLGRPVLKKLAPSNEWHALGILLGVLATAALLFMLLRWVARWFGLP